MFVRISLALGALTLLWSGAGIAQDSNAVEVSAAYTVRSNVLYHVAGSQQLTLDLYLPRNTRLAPIVIYFHGGGWVFGDRHESSLQFLPYLEKGFVVANVSYRLAEAAAAPAAVVDALCAVRWISRNAAEFGGDAARIVTTGHSAGGHLAMIAGLLPPDTPFASECASFDEVVENAFAPARVAAVVNWYGIADVNDLLTGPNRRVYAVRWIGSQGDGASVARSVSPLTYVRAGVAPLISIHGDADRVVPYGHAIRMRDALAKDSVVTELVTIPAGGHGSFSMDQNQDAYQRIWSFLTERGILR